MYFDFSIYWRLMLYFSVLNSALEFYLFVISIPSLQNKDKTNCTKWFVQQYYEIVILVYCYKLKNSKFNFKVL